MYAYITGVVADIEKDRAVLDNEGIGYELLCSSNTLSRIKIGERQKLLVHFHVLEDSLTFYGFYTQEERAMFRQLITVTRVGPKLALSVLSFLTVNEVASAILTENTAALAKVPGMGTKTAARVLLELKEKISGAGSAAAGLPSELFTVLDMRSEVIDALISLGYDPVSAGRAVKEVPECEKIEDMITSALKLMTRGK